MWNYTPANIVNNFETKKHIGLYFNYSQRQDMLPF